MSKLICGDDMIIDITGIELTPGNNGEDCKGNGKHLDENESLIECCCEECDYLPAVHQMMLIVASVQTQIAQELY